jgi:predicted O-methyltransferase YrrM
MKRNEQSNVPMNPVLETILATSRVEDPSGNEYPLDSGISRNECRFVSEIIGSDPSIRRTLEVGCAHGISSLAICASLSERASARHIIIDPHQHDQWHDVGIASLRRAGIQFFELIEEPSEFALPTIAKTESGAFDLVLIDGWHTFDHTLLDIFYADRLLRAGGYIVIDDASMASVSRAVSYLSRFPGYQLWGQVREPEASFRRKLAGLLLSVVPQAAWDYVLPKKLYDGVYRARFTSMVAFQKVEEIARNWDWYEDF